MLVRDPRAMIESRVAKSKIKYSIVNFLIKKNRFFSRLRFLPKFQFLPKFSFYAKFRFLTKISIFNKTSIFDQNFDFRPNFKFWTKISSFHQIFDFYQIFDSIFLLFLPKHPNEKSKKYRNDVWQLAARSSSKDRKTWSRM